TEVTEVEAGENVFENEAALIGSNVDESEAGAAVSVEGEEMKEETEDDEAEEESGFSLFSMFSSDTDGEETEITENILTNVLLSVRGEDDSREEIEPGTPIRVDDPENPFQVHLRYEFALPNNHGYEAGATYTITLPDMLTMTNNPEPTEL